MQSLDWSFTNLQYTYTHTHRVHYRELHYTKVFQEFFALLLPPPPPMSGSPREVKTEEKSPNSQTLKPVKKEPEERAQGSKSPHNG